MSTRLPVPSSADHGALVACCRSFFGDRTVNVKDELRRVRDWPAAFEHGRFHGILPLLGAVIGAMDEGSVPDQQAHRLTERLRLNRGRNAALGVELQRILTELAAHGWDAAVLKGPVLAARAYGDLGLRECGDLDLLVRRRDFARVVSHLGTLGFEPVHGLTASEQAVRLGRVHALELVRDRDSPFLPVVVDLHWDIAPPSQCVSLPYEALERRLRPARVALLSPGLLNPPVDADTPSDADTHSPELNLLAPEEELLMLAIHGWRHTWEQLILIADVAAVVNLAVAPAGATGPAFDWDRVWHRAGGLGTRRLVATALRLARDLFGAPVPEAVGLGGDPMVGRATAYVRERLQRRDWTESGRRQFRRELRERPTDRLLMLSRRLLTPSLRDHRWLGLPAVLHPVYPAVRLVRLAVESVVGSRR